MYMNSLNSELCGVARWNLGSQGFHIVLTKKGEREREMNTFASKLCITVKNSININKTKYQNITSHLGNSLNINNTTHVTLEIWFSCWEAIFMNVLYQYIPAPLPCQNLTWVNPSHGNMNVSCI